MLCIIFVPSKQDWRKLSLVHRTQRVDAHNLGYVDFKKSVGVQVPHLVLINLPNYESKKPTNFNGYRNSCF